MSILVIVSILSILSILILTLILVLVEILVEMIVEFGEGDLCVIIQYEVYQYSPDVCRLARWP